MFRLLLSVWLCFIGLFSIAQSKDSNIPIFFEKVYLHTDRDIYGQGEDLWFKAYVVNAQDNKPINYSHNLYVELIGPQTRLIKRETIRLEEGLGNGDFKLSDTISPGRYRIRAYTNWMRNFGDNFVFEKNITILNTQAVSVSPDPKVAVNLKNKIKNRTTATTATTTISPATTTVRFYPEGGSLVEGISSIIGVKAEDGYGKGIMVSGSVLSSGGDTVSRFSCDSLGMGLLTLLPVKGQSYHAVVDLTDRVPHQPDSYRVRPTESVFPLPLTLSTGLTLQVKQTDTVIHAVINSSTPSTADKISFAVKHGGKTMLSKQLSLQNGQTAVRIPTASLPEGISAITIYNNGGKPECERLVYVHHPNNKSTISLQTDKNSYQSKGQVTVSIQAPPHTRLSLAAVDAGMVPVQPENIVSYLNLQSEIRGNIEHPDRYFDTTNVNRFKQLDQLLLTQGWRDFIWRRLEDTTLKLSYEPEQGIAITGKVRAVMSKKPLAGISISMRAPKADGQKLFWATTDSAGRFAIYDTKFYGYQYISFTSRQSSKMRKDGSSKGNSGGYIQVDSLLRDTLPVKGNLINSIEDSTWAKSKQADVAIEQIRRSLKLKNDHNLKEVTIKSNTSRLVTILPPELHAITLTEQREYGSLAQYLLSMIEGARLSSIIPIFLMQMGFPPKPIPIIGTYIDHTKIDYRYILQEQYLNLPMSNVMKVTIKRSEDVNGKHISVDVVLRPGVLDTKDYFDNTMADMVGYYRAKEFYKPRFENPGDVDTRTNTIYWEPNITIDRTGKTTVPFYNINQPGKVRVVVQGVTDTGIPLVATTGYVVK